MEYLKGEQLEDESDVTILKKTTTDNKNYFSITVVVIKWIYNEQKFERKTNLYNQKK